MIKSLLCSMLLFAMVIQSNASDITFRVTNGSSGLANATVTLNSNNYTTDAGGIAVASSLSEGTYAFTVAATGYVSTSGSVTVTASNDDLYVVLQAVSAPSYRYEIALTNEDLESNTSMANDGSGTRYNLDGFFFNLEASNTFKFDEANSGVEPTEGLNGSQALKLTTQQTATNNASFHVTLNTDQVDISSFGNGTYRFSFYIRSLTAPSSNPVFIIPRAYDASNQIVSNETISSFVRDVNWVGMEAGYVKQSVTFTLADNTSGGANASSIQLVIQSAAQDNTYFFDNFELTGPLVRSEAAFTVTDATSTTPIAGATVTVNGANYTTDGNGVATATGLTAGNYVYSVTATNYLGSTGEITLTDSDITETVTLTPFTPRNFTFRVTNGVSALANASVTVGSNSYTTDASGVATASSLGQGTQSFSVSSAGYNTVNGVINVQGTDEDVYVALEESTSQPTYHLPMTNGDFQNDITLVPNNGTSPNRYSFDGFFVNLTQGQEFKFDASNSGAAPLEGLNGSQALKLIIQQTATNAASFHVTFNSDDVDIRNHGNGRYTFSYYFRTASAPTKSPFFPVVIALDASNNVVTNQTVSSIDRVFVWQNAGVGYVKQSISFTLSDNTSGGANATKIRLGLQSSLDDNTYFIDNVKLEAPLPVPSLEVTTLSASSTSLSWTVSNPEGLDGFEIWRSTSPTEVPDPNIDVNNDPKLIKTVTATAGKTTYTFVDNNDSAGLSPGTTYYYSIRSKINAN